MRKNRVEWNGSGYTRSDCKKIKNLNPLDPGAIDTCVTEGEGEGEGEGDGHSIY